MTESLVSYFAKVSGYTFKDASLLTLAFTHRSANELHNERLEFLGDAILEVIVSELLYTKHPELHEGALSQWRSRLVEQAYLAEMAQQHKLEPWVITGQALTPPLGDRVMSSVVEAVIAAIYQDNGDYLGTRDIIIPWLQLDQHMGEPPTSLKDAKSALQEWCQQQAIDLPTYTVIDEVLQPDTHFVIRCEVHWQGQHYYADGEGHNKRAAEQLAADGVKKQLV